MIVVLFSVNIYGLLTGLQFYSSWTIVSFLGFWQVCQWDISCYRDIDPPKYPVSQKDLWWAEILEVVREIIHTDCAIFPVRNSFLLRTRMRHPSVGTDYKTIRKYERHHRLITTRSMIWPGMWVSSSFPCWTMLVEGNSSTKCLVSVTAGFSQCISWLSSMINSSVIEANSTMRMTKWAKNPSFFNWQKL